MPDASTIQWALAVLPSLIVGFGVWMVRSYLSNYLNEKGKNLATKEDIGEITHKIEAAKKEYADQLASFQAALGSRTHIHHIRYEHEFQTLLTISERVVDLRDAAAALFQQNADERAVQISGGRRMMLTPRLHNSEPEGRTSLLDRFGEAATAFYRTCETHRPFFHKELYSSLKDLIERINLVYFVDHVFPDARKPSDEVQKELREFDRSCDGVMIAIQRRVRVWERFDPGPDSGHQ